MNKKFKIIIGPVVHRPTFMILLFQAVETGSCFREAYQYAITGLRLERNLDEKIL